MSSTDLSDMRMRILAEGARLFVERGYHGLAMREIAESVGGSKAGLYYHFRDKEELFLAILMRCLDQLEHALEGAQPPAPGVRAGILAILQAIFTLPPEQRAVMRMASSEIGHLSTVARARFGQRYYASFIGRVEAAISAGIAAGELRPIDPQLATWILLGMAYPFFTPSSARELGSSADTIAAIMAVFFDGAAA
jgi:AcrR family transcriptional regulator